MARPCGQGNRRGGLRAVHDGALGAGQPDADVQRRGEQLPLAGLLGARAVVGGGAQQAARGDGDALRTFGETLIRLGAQILAHQLHQEPAGHHHQQRHHHPDH